MPQAPRPLTACHCPRAGASTRTSTPGPSISSDSVERRQTIEYFRVADTVSTLEATVSRLEAGQQALASQMAAGGTAAAVAADMASRTMGLMSTATANQVRSANPFSLSIS